MKLELVTLVSSHFPSPPARHPSHIIIKQFLNRKAHWSLSLIPQQHRKEVAKTHASRTIICSTSQYENAIICHATFLLVQVQSASLWMWCLGWTCVSLFMPLPPVTSANSIHVDCLLPHYNLTFLYLCMHSFIKRRAGDSLLRMTLNRKLKLLT